MNKEKVKVKAKIYNLTDDGKKLLQESSIGGRFGGSIRGFCVANYKVDEVNNYTEPSQAMGVTMSKVNYSFSPCNIKEWVKNKSVEKAFPQLSMQLQENQKSTGILILTNDGWVHQKEIQL